MKVLFVCLGNICRSPAAEGVLKALLIQKQLDRVVEVDSAGTGDWHVGEKADPRMRQAALTRGIELTSKGRQVCNEDFENFDWVIAMDSDNFRNLRSMSGAHRCQNLIQFRKLVNSRQIDGVPDPYYGGSEGFEEVLDILEEGCNELANQIIDKYESVNYAKQ